VFLVTTNDKNYYILLSEELSTKEWSPPVLSEEAKMALLECISNLFTHYDPSLKRESIVQPTPENNTNTAQHQNILQMTEFLPSLGYFFKVQLKLHS
jgi:hypothetical protein